MLIATVLLLDCLGSCFPLFNFVGSELLPKLVEFSCVLLTVVGVINNQHVLLIVATSLESPVEGASQHEHIVHDTELIVHVVFGCRVSPHLDASVRKSLNVRALVRSALVI